MFSAGNFHRGVCDSNITAEFSFIPFYSFKAKLSQKEPCFHSFVQIKKSSPPELVMFWV